MVNKYKMELSQQIRKRRCEMGYSQLELAEKCGISQNQISDYEWGKVQPQVKILHKLGAALGFSRYNLISGNFDDEATIGEMTYNLD